MRRGFPVAALASSVALSGCASTGAEHPASGKALFAADCSQCHSLVGNESLARQGGDLRAYRLSHRDLLEFTREMPVSRPLGASQLEAVVHYVASKERSSGRH